MDPHSKARTLKRLSTGSPVLDRILGGGIPERSITVIAGLPGSGKTIFTLQMLFHLARGGMKCLYFTTLSEPAIKLIRFMQLFPFFDQRLFDEQIVLFDLGNALRSTGSERALSQIVERVEEEEPGLVVIDSFKAIAEMIGSQVQGRSYVYDLAVQMASWGATTVLVGEYAQSDIVALPEFAIADGIILMDSQRHELTSVREVEVLKLRGAGYVSGRHFFEVHAGGLSFYPRVRAPDDPGHLEQKAQERVPLGVPGFDDLLGGGLPRYSATVVQGGTGTGKTLLGLHFLLEGVRREEPVVLFTLEETVDQLRGIAANYGWDLASLEARGLLHLVYASPVELSTDQFLYLARQRIASAGARRAVLDSLTSMALGVPSERRFKELVYALTKHFRAAGVTMVMTMEVPDLLGSTLISGHGISFAADNVIQLRYVESEGELSRAISVIKARGTRHSTQLRRAEIGADGMRVGEAFADLRGVLTGNISLQGMGRE